MSVWIRITALPTPTITGVNQNRIIPLTYFLAATYFVLKKNIQTLKTKGAGLSAIKRGLGDSPPEPLLVKGRVKNYYKLKDPHRKARVF